MLMKNELKVDGHTIRDARFPYLGHKQEDILDHWEGQYSPYTGHELIAKVLTLAGYDSFNQRRYQIVDKGIFNIFTKDGKTVKVRISYADVDNPSEVIVTCDNKEEHYEIGTVTSTNNIYVTPQRTVDLSNNFTQYYSVRHDTFGKEEDGIKTFITIGRDKKDTESNKDEFYFIDEDIKKEFINTKFNNLLEVYYFLTQRFDKTSRYMSMSTYDKHFYPLDSIKITNGMVDDLRLTTLMLGNRVRLEGEDPNTMALNDLIESAESSGKQFKLELRSK